MTERESTSPSNANRSDRALVLLTAALIVLFVAAAAIGARLLWVSSGSTFTAELGKLFLTLSVALAVDGAVSVVAKHVERYHTDRAKAEDLDRAERSQWGDLLAQVVGVDEALASARQLILTHRTVKTYGDPVSDPLRCPAHPPARHQ
ncbi:hypothetical protein BJF90_35035 [Pseudonocardia sp. CNS-004]|nr:hypothetical protein BJF90_35035 [Pseudonocardia sp. CNS-004]